MTMRSAYAGELAAAWQLTPKEAARAHHEVGRLSNIVQWAYQDEPLYDFQRAFNDDHTTPAMLIEKPRQCGFSSRMVSSRSTVKALSIQRHKSIYTSHNMNDCKEKIEYARDLYLRLWDLRSQRDRLPTLVLDNLTELKFSNGSRLISVFYPRGKDKADVYLDEFAHYRSPRKIWKACQGPIIHPGTQVVIGSSPTHSRSMFARIKRREGGKFRDIVRAKIYWWDCALHCTDVAQARIEAPFMDTATRAARFGSVELLRAFNNNLIEDFQQEYELNESDDASAYLSWELILHCTPTGEDGIETHDTVAELKVATKRKELYFGYDVGRRKDKGQLSVFEIRDGMRYERYTVEMDNRKFVVQEEAIAELLQLPNVLCGAIDETGIGMELAERLADRFPGRVLGISFSDTTKKLMAGRMKTLMLEDKVRFEPDTQKNYQMHSVKKKYTASENLVLRMDTSGDADESGEGDLGGHHADVFWARALALWAEKESAFVEPNACWIET